MPRVQNRPHGSDRNRAQRASGRVVTTEGFLMNDRWREVGDPQTVIIQTDGELCPKARPQRKNAAAVPAQLKLQSTGGYTRHSSGPLTFRVCHASDSPKTIQSP